MKRLILVGLLLLAVSANAQMSPRLDSLITWLEAFGNLPAGGTDDIGLGDEYKLINMACQSVSSTLPAIEKLDTVSVDSAESINTVNSDFVSLKAVYQIVDDTLRIPIEIISPDSLAAEYADKTPDQNTSELSDKTDNRKCWVHNYYLRLHPRWARGDTATYEVEYFARDSMLHTSASQTQIKGEYRPEIVRRAVGYLWMLRGNFEKAAAWLGDAK